MVRLELYFRIGEQISSLTWVREVCKLYSIKKLTTTACHPQTDGLVEHLNSTLCQTLSMYVSKNQKDWDVFIPAALFAFRTSPSESTGESLFTCCMGGNLVSQWK